MFYGEYEYRFGKERMEEARKTIQQARQARESRASKDPLRTIVAYGAVFTRAAFR